jgi:hypothetical protein
LDQRIHVPSGIVALAFTYRPGGAAGPPSPFRIRYLWRETSGDRIEVLDDEGRICERIPGVQDPEHEKVLRGHFQKTSRELRQMVLGVRLADLYADFRGDVVRTVKNGEESVSLVLEPRNPKRLRRVTIELGRDGLPWRTQKEYLSQDRLVQHHTWETRGDVHVLTVVQHIYTPAVTGQRGEAFAHRFTWQKIGGRLLLASVRKEGPDLPPEVTGTTEFQDMQVNEDVPEFTPQ